MNRKITRVEIEPGLINIYRGEWDMRAYPYSARNFSRLSFVCGIQPEGLTRYHTDRLEWYRNVESRTPQYVNGDWGSLHFELQPNWNLKLTVDHQQAFNDALEYGDENFWRTTYEILDPILTEGWEIDPDDDGRVFISQAHLNEYGDEWGGETDPYYGIQPGDLGWYHENYVYAFWYEELKEKGSVTFRPYYFGETLDEQRSL